MTSPIVGALVTVIFALFVSWLKGRLEQARADREARDVAELETKVTKQALADEYDIEARHEARLQKILDGSLSDDDMGRMLSQPPGGDEIPGAADPENGDRGGPAMP